MTDHIGEKRGKKLLKIDIFGHFSSWWLFEKFSDKMLSDSNMTQILKKNNNRRNITFQNSQILYFQIHPVLLHLNFLMTHL